MSINRVKRYWVCLSVIFLATGCQQPAGTKDVSSTSQPAPPSHVQTPAPAAEVAATQPAPTSEPGDEAVHAMVLEAMRKIASRDAASTQPDETSKAIAAAIVRQLAEAQPKRPTTPPWVILREVFDETADATCAADWTGENRLEVHTENIKRLTLDLNRLPSGAPGRGPWNLQLDGQGIQITGFHGKVLDLVRSKAGNWTVDRTKFKK
jgi:hypothetical protein